MADPKVSETQAAQCGLGRVDLAELVRGDCLVVRDTGRQAGGGGLVGIGQTEGATHRPYVGFGQTDPRQGAKNTMICGSTRSGTIDATDIVGVLAVCDRIESVTFPHAAVDAGEQLVLTEEATVRPVGLIVRILELTGMDLDHGRSDERGDVVSVHSIVGRQAR
jgi:hypothetical protein